MQNPTRRSFIKSAAALAGTAFSPNLLLGQENALKQLNVAAVGCGGKGWSDISEIANGNRIAFLCDIDQAMAAKAIERFPEARYFSDYREMFAAVADQIDVVTVSTPDHMHFPVAVEAIKHGKPVMVQKPMCNTLWEARALANYAKEKGVLTVMGNQGATMEGTRILREWIESGLIGDVKEVYYWTNRPIWPQGTGLTFPAQPVPATINWDVWQGTCATDRPYNPAIHPFKWRGFWDYGCGALGDIGCHSMNSAFWALDLNGDFVVESSKVSEFDENMAPKRSTIVYHFPAKGKRAAVKVIWQDGIADPNTDKDFVRPPGIPDDLKLNEGFGQVFVGTEGAIFINDAYCGTAPVVYPEALREKTRSIQKVYDRVKGGPTQELCRAVRGDGPKPVSNFVDHAGPLTEMVLAGNLSVRLGKKIDWDSKNMEARGLPEVKAMLKRKYRAGWEPKLT
jgi:predicted dehydrogenase